VEPFVEIVRFVVAGVAVGVTEVVTKLHAAKGGLPVQERFTAPPKLAFTDDTVTVTAGLACPLVVEVLSGEIAMEKSTGAAATLVTNASVFPPYVPWKADLRGKLSAFAELVDPVR
jgi:hypothetical protein